MGFRACVSIWFECRRCMGRYERFCAVWVLCFRACDLGLVECREGWLVGMGFLQCGFDNCALTEWRRAHCWGAWIQASYGQRFRVQGFVLYGASWIHLREKVQCRQGAHSPADFSSATNCLHLLSFPSILIPRSKS